MSFKDLLDQVKQHPKIVAVAMFACLVVGSVGAGFYLKVSEARIALLDERMKAQETDSKKQKYVNRLVQDQVGSLRKGFEGLPVAVSGVRAVLSEAERARAVPGRIRTKFDSTLQSVEHQLVVLQAAISNSEALSKSLETLISGAIAEEEKRYADAANLYRIAANAGVPDAQARLARLYVAGKGVERNTELAAQLFETSALLGNIGAKDDAVELYFAGHGATSPNIRAAALLAIEPRSETQAVVQEDLYSKLSEVERKLLTELILVLRKTQADLADRRTASSSR